MTIVGFSFADSCAVESLSITDLLFLEPEVITGLGEWLVSVSSALEGDQVSQTDTSWMTDILACRGEQVIPSEGEDTKLGKGAQL